MPALKTFLDSGVLITAFQGETNDSQKAFALINDIDREFVVSAFLKLELLPQPTWHRRVRELEFLEEFFKAARHYANATEELATAALQVAGADGLQAMDALHVAAALQFGVVEFITTEKREKPIHRVAHPKVIHLSDCPAPP